MVYIKTVSSATVVYIKVVSLSALDHRRRKQALRAEFMKSQCLSFISIWKQAGALTLRIWIWISKALKDQAERKAKEKLETLHRVSVCTIVWASLEMFMVIGCYWFMGLNPVTWWWCLLFVAQRNTPTVYLPATPQLILQNVFSINDKNKTPRSNVASCRCECFLRFSLQIVFSI